MPRVTLIDRKTKVGVKALRVAMGGKGHRPSAFNACVGAKLKGKPRGKQPEGLGGLRNDDLHKAFALAAQGCGANIGDAAMKKLDKSLSGWEKAGGIKAP